MFVVISILANYTRIKLKNQIRINLLNNALKNQYSYNKILNYTINNFNKVNLMYFQNLLKY